MSIAAEQFDAILVETQQKLESIDLGPFFRETALPMVLQNVRDNFTSSVSPDGAEWPPRKDPGDGHPLLIESGDMMQSAVGGGAGHITRVEPLQLEVGTSEFKAGFHTDGTKYMPPRKFMGASEATEASIEEKLADYVLEKVFGG